MICERITLDGFLCYRHRQTIDLSGTTLCMLSGPNGSGKSSVFDGITFALFGSHRAGKDGRDDLVNKRCDSATVEFDFTCGGTRWQARRTITRRPDGSTKPTQQVRRQRPGTDQWEPVPDTASVAGYKTWVEHNVGLSAEAFTASMLLRQGEADRLLLAQPADKAAFLRDVVGLGRYAQLYESARARHRSAEAELTAVAARRDGCRPVSDDAVDAAATAAADADRTATEAAALADRLGPAVEQAKAWVAMTFRHTRTTADRQAATAVLDRRGTITAAHERLCQLQAALPALTAVADARSRAARSAQAIARLSAAAEQASADAGQRADELAHARTTVEQLDGRCHDQSAHERQLADDLAELTRVLALADATAHQRRELAQLTAERDGLPTDPAADADRAGRAVARLRDLSAALPWLRLLVDSRAALAAANAAIADTAGRQASLANDLVAATADVRAAADAQTSAEAHRATAQQQVADAQAALTHARGRVADLAQLDGQAECPACGKPLTGAQRDAEATRRADDERRATVAHEAAARSLTAADERGAQLGQARKAAQDRHAVVVAEQREADRQARELERDIAGHDRAAAQAHAALPEHVRPPDNPTAAPWPTAVDLAESAVEVASIAQAEQTLAHANALLARWRDLSAHVAALRRVLADAPADLPADVAPLRASREQLAREHAAVRQALEPDRFELKRAADAVRAHQAQLDRLTAAAHAAGLQLAQEQARHDGHLAAVALARGQLPPAWVEVDPPPAALAGWTAEADRLARAGVVADAERLRVADAQAAALDAQLSQLQNDLDAIPPDARRPVGQVESLLAAARADRDAAQSRARDARADHDALARDRDVRRRLDADHRRCADAARQLRRLAELLDRRNLQLHLLRRAEGQIVAFANAVLDRLSGGSLTLRLRPAATDDDGAVDRALDLQAIDQRTAGTDALNVAFLSGSQQFRVAVALALAVGQYAGGGHRLGDCVIIDEGFGSLDRQGQEVMIAELHRLTGLMRRVILVSHQESFADAFPHGYRFALDPDGATRVTRLTT